MNDDIVEYKSQSQILAKIEYRPVDAVPSGMLVIRDASNQVLKQIDLTPANIDSWIDLTVYVQKAERGIVEAHLLRTVGYGPWRAKLYLHATQPADLGEDLERDQRNYLVPSVLFRRKS